MSLFKIREVARILKVTSQTVLQLVSDRKIGSITIGKRSRIDSSDLARFLTTHRKDVEN